MAARGKAEAKAMLRACSRGDLDMAQRLKREGTLVTPTPRHMEEKGSYFFVACKRGHLNLCKWLVEEGVAIKESNGDGITPIRAAYMNEQLPVFKFLVFIGALCYDSENEDSVDSDIEVEKGHVDIGQVCEATAIWQENPWRAGRVPDFVEDNRDDLLAWSQSVVATHYTFLHVVLRASVIPPQACHHHASPDQRCHLPRLPRSVLEQLADFLGVEMGRRLRNVREFGDNVEELLELEKDMYGWLVSK